MKERDKQNVKTVLPRIVVKFRDDVKIPHPGASEIIDFFSLKDSLLWRNFFEWYPQIQISRLFTSLTPENIIKLVKKARISDALYHPPDLMNYFVFSCPQEVYPDEFVSILQGLEGVELAYIQSGAGNPSKESTVQKIVSSQGYLNPAPEGINANYAWLIPGGKGEADVRFIDIEQGWILNHEAYFADSFPLTGVNNKNFQDHGAAVLGVIMMRDYENGRIGITPEVKGHVISLCRPDGSLNDADAILSSIYYLNFGDVILLEAQAFHTTGSNKIWPVEIHEATFQSIRLATALGITVIEAAGNGDLFNSRGNDLDLFSLNQKKILDTASPDFKDSGAILVSAASQAVPHHRIRYSNYGSRINCYAWGAGVDTAGAYPGSSGSAVDRYNGNFNGTSSASAIIAGAVIAVQSISKAKCNTRLDPKQMRDIVGSAEYGTPSANGQMIDKIGVMPDLRKIIRDGLGVRLPK